MKNFIYKLIGKENENNFSYKLAHADKTYLKDNNLMAPSANRKNKNDSSIDKIHQCTFTRANTITENTSRFLLYTDKINTVNFALFRGVILEKGSVEKMLKEKSAFNFVTSDSSKKNSTGCGNTHVTCYEPISRYHYANPDYANQEQESVIFVIPPNLFNLKKGFIQNAQHAFLLDETDFKLKDLPITKYWKVEEITYIQLGSKS